MPHLSTMTLRRSERGVIIGGTGSGKSTLAEFLIRDFYTRYPNGRVIIADTKPRFRAERYTNGMSAKREFRRWDHGAVMADSVLVRDAAEFDLAWTIGARILILQGTPAAVSRLVGRVMAKARASRPTLVYVDETLDFYGSNGQPVRGATSSLLEVSRKGRELGVAGLYAAQRTKGFPVQIMQEASRIYVFRFDYVEDVDRLRDCGAPPAICDTPEVDHLFTYWTKQQRGTVWGPYRLDIRKAG